MRTIKIALLFISCLLINLQAQDDILFNDSPTETSYDPSWAFVKSPSLFERVGEKIPVATNYFYSGMNSLKYSWTSKSGGDWGGAIASPGWPGHDITNKDSLTIWVMAADFIGSENLPVIYLEDLSNNKTSKINLSSYSGDLTKEIWTKISIPVSVIQNNIGSANLTKVKTLFLGQGTADDAAHTLYVDEIRFVSAGELVDTEAPLKPVLNWAKGYKFHVDLNWNENIEPDLFGYKIYKITDSTPELLGIVGKDNFYYSHFSGVTNESFSYKITAIDSSNNESEFSEEVSAATRAMDTEEMLTMLQESTFRYFWDYAHPVSGLMRERLGSGDIVTSGGSGFGIMALVVGVERGFVTREECVTRMLKILNFLDTKADRFHGAYSHWLNGSTGEAIPFSSKDDGGDLVETAFLIQGLLAARSYFDLENTDETQIRNLITKIWEEVEWDWYRRYASSNFLYWHWSPNYNWDMNFALQGPNETMITYMLAIASPTHSVPASLYHNGWASSNNYLNGKSFYGYTLDVGWDYGGPLFFAHYSFLGFDPRNKKDSYTNYFINNKNHTLINRAYCIQNPKSYTGYDENTWGLTASDDPFGYSAHEPTASRDNGTITPTGALSSMPYTPDESISAFLNFYDNYGEKLWGAYGFKDAFNPAQNWYASSYIAIDQGPIIVMVENYRSALIWELFMENQEIQSMLDSVGFVEDFTGTDEIETLPKSSKLNCNYPNPFNPETSISYSINKSGMVNITVFDLLGRAVDVLVNKDQPAGTYSLRWKPGNNLSSGIYFYRLTAGNFSQTKKMLLLR